MLMFADFETLYDDEYSLKKMTPIEYILDPRFEALGCAFIDGGGAKCWIDGPDLPAFFADIDWGKQTVVSHNALFDALILAFRYHVVPAKYGCTLSMARNWLAHMIGSCSLDSVAKFYGMAKGHLPTKGVNCHELAQRPDLRAALVEYALNDVSICRTAYDNMLEDGFPRSELDVIDWVVRMAARPQLEIDPMVVAEHLSEVQAHKAQLLANAGLETRDNLMRDDVLAAMLTMHGVEVPKKSSPAHPEKEIWAFAKTDKAFTELLEHPNINVQAIVAARLGHKSTLEETRAQRFMAIATMTDAFPVPLKYSGAHTHRFSGDWKLNLQNLPTHASSKLRKALRAPKGSVVVSVDASQIEARINAMVSGETALVDAFRLGNDIYAQFAGEIYGRHINKRQHPSERFVGKTAILSLGYSSSWPVFQNMVRVKGDGITLSDSDASRIVMLYRARYPAIVDHWKVADRQILPMIAQGQEYQWGALKVGFETLTLPNGNALHYRQLRHEYSTRDERYQWTYTRGQIPHKVYGAKIVENECQALAFVHITEVAMRVMKLTEGLLWPAHQIHDELVYVVQEHLAEQVRDLVVEEMAKPPAWLPDVPFAAEGHIGQTYGDTK